MGKDEAMNAWETMAVVGRIVRPHGNRGHVLVQPETDFPDVRFGPSQVFYVRRNGNVTAVTVTALRMHRGRPIIGLCGINDIGAAEELTRLELRVPAQMLTPLPSDRFYRHDLVGCAVSTVAGAAVGTVVAVGGSVGGAWLVVQDGRAEVLIPLAADIVLAVDVAQRRITVDPPAGLLELNG